MPTKDELRAQRAALIERLHALPVAMKSRPQWLVWKFIKKPKVPKPAKVPFYTNGHARGWPNGKPRDGKATDAQPQVEQGHELDRAALVGFEAALAAIEAQPSWHGIGFAFLPGDGLIGVDIDGAVDLETGEISPRALLVMKMCSGFTERSVSGTGMHIIMTGQVEGFKSDAIGLEVYCGRQYFICTGEAWSGRPAEPEPADHEALAVMRGMCEQANEKAKAEAAALRAAAADGQSAKSAPPVRAAPAPSSAAADGESDFKRVNAEAMLRLSAWVPELFPGARPYSTKYKGDGYRISSASLGRELQEDLGIMPGGIRDFGTGVEGTTIGNMTAIDVVVKFGHMTPREALHWLAQRVGVDISRRPQRPASASRPEPPAEGAAGAGSDGRPDPPPTPLGKNAAHARSGGGGEAAEEADAGQEAGAQAGGGGKGRGPLPKHVQANLEALRAGFAYQYGSKIAWDLARRESIEIANLRHTFGSDAVRIWMNSPDRRVIYGEQVMFEPGQELPADCLNLFGGLPSEPEEGDYAVMQELLRHLCATSEAPGMGPEDIADWVMRWCALPLQQIGAKMTTALVFHGPQGTGKNLFFDVLRDMYGEYGVMVGQTELEERYNTWLSGKMLIIGDEVVSRQEMYHTKNRLKWIITQETKIPIRAMHADTRWESNHANLIFLSNESQPLALEAGDRRFMVIYTPVAEDGDLYARVREFLAAGGARRFLHYLQTLDLQDFNRHTKPPLTKAKEALIELGYKPAERFMHEWLGGYLPLPMRVCSTEQLYRAFRRWSDSTGERYYPKQAEFTLQASRFAMERIERDAEGKRLDPPFRVKTVQVPHEAAVTGRKSYRCWIPRGCGFRELPPPDDATEQEKAEAPTEGGWARECIDEFEAVLKGFLRPSRLDGGGDERPEPP